jgi:hypothetical protein
MTARHRARPAAKRRTARCRTVKIGRQNPSKGLYTLRRRAAQNAGIKRERIQALSIKRPEAAGFADRP